MLSRNSATILKNVLITTVGKYAEYIIALVCGAIIARSLGPTDYGVYAYLIWLAGWLIMLSNISLPMTALRFIAESRGKTKSEQADVVYKILSFRQSRNSLFVCLSFLIFTQFYIPSTLVDVSPLLFIVISVAVFAKARYMFTTAVAKGYERFDLEAVSSIVVGLVNLLLIIWLSIYQNQFENYVYAYMLASMLLVCILSILCKRSGITPSPGELGPEYIQRVNIHQKMTFMLGLTTIFSIKAITIFLLGEFGSREDIAYLTIAHQLTKGCVDLLTVGLASVVMPQMAYAFGEEDLSRVKNILLESTRYYIFFGAGVAAVGMLVAQPIILLLYQDEFLPGVWVLQLVMAISGFSASTSAMGAFLSTTDNQSLRVKIAFSLLAANFISALIFVPAFGLRGVIYAMIVSLICSVLINFGCLAKTLGIRFQFWLYSKIIAAAVLPLGIFYLVNQYYESLYVNLLLVLFYGPAYLMFTLIFRCWYERDKQIIVHLLSKLPLPIIRKNS